MYGCLNANFHTIEWEYLNEGASSYVFISSDKQYVLRCQKMCKSFKYGNSYKYKFNEQIISKLIDHKYLPKRHLLQINKEIIIGLEKKLISLTRKRPFYPIYDNDSTVEIMQNLTNCFTTFNQITIEIKPKWSFLTSGENYCRYCKHKQLKIKENSTYKSTFCPLDIFSRCPHRVRRALISLYEFPNNNMKIYHNNSIINKISDDVFRTLHLTSKTESFFDLLMKILFDDHTNSLNNEILPNDEICSSYNNYCSCSLVNEHRKNNNIFDVINFYQRLSKQDINDIYNLLKNTYDSKLSNITYEDVCWDTFTENLKIKNIDDQYSIISSFLLSTTFKDCSVMISIACDDYILPKDHNDTFSTILYNDIKYLYAFKIIDTDPRTIDDIPRLYELNKKINSLFQEKSMNVN